MAYKQIKMGLKNEGNLVQLIEAALKNESLTAVQGQENFSGFSSKFDLARVQGAESQSLNGMLATRLNDKNYAAFQSSFGRSSNVAPSELKDIVERTESFYGTVDGLEGFSMQNYEGSETTVKALNMALNAQSHLQTPGAEALFATLTVRYEDEGVLMKVRAAGLGTYAYGNSAWQSASELQPIFGLLRSGKMFAESALAVHPVYPESDTDDTRELFVLAADRAPWTATYMEADALGRENHLTSFLKVPSVIPNFLGLCQTPGQRPYTATDEIESNSLTGNTLQLTAKIKGVVTTFFINTKAMSNNTFIPTSNGQSSDDRKMSILLNRHNGFAIQDKAGLDVGETIFADLKAAGYRPLLDVSMDGNYQRQKNVMRLNGGQISIAALEHIVTGNVITRDRADDAQKVLFRTLTDGSVTGIEITGNVTNNSRGNFGYRIEVFDADKHLSVKRGDPVSVKYPIDKQDVNQGSLDYAIEQMSVAINNQCSRKAFDMAKEHLAYITSIDGHAVVSNNQGSNVLPGMHYVQASAVNRQITLADVVSTQDSTGVLEAVCAVFTNEISDIVSALTTKSGIAAIAEYGGATSPKWNIIAHQNLCRFLLRLGDARTLGPLTTMKAVETNFDSQIGEILIVTQNDSTSDYINPLGGVGVVVSKENIVVQGNVTRDQQDFGVVMTIPTYKHWALNPIIGSLKITDAAEFLGDNGLLTKLAKQRIAVEGLGAALTEIKEAIEAGKP